MTLSRTTCRKAYYFLVVVGGSIALAAVARNSRESNVILPVVVILLLVPGRILGYFWSDLLRGLRLLNEKRYEESIVHSRAFLATLKQRPWIRHLIWLGSGTYSRNPESFAFNNIGAAEIGLGQFESARVHLHEAILHDSLNPLPFHNLAVIAGKEGNAEEAALMAASAAQRGFTDGVTDKIVRSSQRRLAQFH